MNHTHRALWQDEGVPAVDPAHILRPLQRVRPVHGVGQAEQVQGRTVYIRGGADGTGCLEPDRYSSARWKDGGRAAAGRGRGCKNSQQQQDGPPTKSQNQSKYHTRARAPSWWIGHATNRAQIAAFDGGAPQWAVFASWTVWTTEPMDVPLCGSYSTI